MRLILTDYIASLREEKELDTLIEQLLRESQFEIFFTSKKGQRQYGVDIYAVGTDWGDGERKVFLVTVKQGNLDRNNWEGSAQALQPSLYNITTVFVRNNIAPEHTDLPIKIIVAHNGVNNAAIQQNWRAFADSFPQFEFVIWQLEALVTLVGQYLINENVFSDEAKRALRKIIINLSDTNYNFSDYTFLLDEIASQVDLSSKAKRRNLNLLRKINLLTSLVIKYSQEENDFRLALKATEITFLRLWKLIGPTLTEPDVDYLGELVRMLYVRNDLHIRYLNRIFTACEVKDGLSVECRDAVSYCFVAYEHLGFIAVAGLEFLQLLECFPEPEEGFASRLKADAHGCANQVISLFNNNPILFNPRADDQVIEISLAFLLLYKLNRLKDLRDLLGEYIASLGYAKMFLNSGPHFSNNLEEIIQLEIDSNKRKDFKHESSCLLTVLAEWTLVCDSPKLYNDIYHLKKLFFEKTDLILWFPDERTEESLYTEYATQKTGYSLSGIELAESYDEFKKVTYIECPNNCVESGFSFFSEKANLWIIGMIASRHYRTYLFPHYWRQLININVPAND